MDRFSGPSGMLVVRDACDKRADNHEDGACLFRVVICVARAMLRTIRGRSLWCSEGLAVARSAYFARRLFFDNQRIG